MDQTSLFSRRDLYWCDAQKVLGALPSAIFQQALILIHNIALNYSDDAQLQNILRRRQDYPLLDQHFWLLDDWEIAESAEREAFEKNLMLGMLFAFMASETKTNIADKYSHLDHRYTALQEELDGQSDFYFKQSFSHRPFDKNRELVSLSITAAATWADKESQLPQLLEMAEHLRLTFQIAENLSTLRRDLRDGRMTTPIQRALQAAGAGGQKNPPVDYVFGLLIFTGTLEKICQENHARIESARGIAIELNLPSFQNFCDNADATMHQIRKQFSLKNQAEAEGARVEPGRNEPLRAFFVPAIDVLPNVIQKAEGYLLSDLTFREAWEVQQNTFKDFPLLKGQAFPSALILEILSLHGHNVAAPIDDIFKIYQSNDFRYYDIPETLEPDIDVVAFAIRLHHYSSEPDWCKELLQKPLRWVRENQMPSGQIPVWLRHNDSQYKLSPLSVLYGSNCATVEANLLLGLIDFDWEGYRDVIETCAASWSERWLNVGLGATEHYTPLFSLWTSLEFVSKLLKQPINKKLQDDLNRVAAKICKRIELEARQPNLTPQSASFLTLASLRLKEFSLPFNSGWLTILLKHNQWDGSWSGEPIYVTPSGRGLSTMWFTSRTITTAFCYHALKCYEQK